MIEILEKKEKTYEFVLRAESGATLLCSIGYANKKKAQEAVRNLNTIKARQISIERKTNHTGEFLFTLKGKSGNLIGNSQLYQSEAGMENGIKNFINRINSLSNSNQL